MKITWGFVQLEIGKWTKKAHAFDGKSGRSLCNKYLAIGAPDLAKNGEPKCALCEKKLKKMEGR